MADRCGSGVALGAVAVTLSAVFLRRMPLAATTGSTKAAQSTPASPAIRSKRPTALTLLDPHPDAQSGSCTGLAYAGAQGTTATECSARATCCHFHHSGGLIAACT